jgi:hypothetical protein
MKLPTDKYYFDLLVKDPMNRAILRRLWLEANTLNVEAFNRVMTCMRAWESQQAMRKRGGTSRKRLNRRRAKNN